MVSKSKRKGDVEERAVINLLRDRGYVCQRTLEKGARSDGTATWDLDIMLDPADPDTATLIGECKLRANGSGFKQLYAWKGDNDFLTVRSDRRERLWVIGEALMLDYLKLKTKEFSQ